MMVLKMPEYNKAFYLAQQDKIVPGISIANSEVGILSLSIEAFYYRLVCTNGLISQTAVDARYKHISRKAMDEFPDILRGVISQSQRGHDRFRISAETPVSIIPKAPSTLSPGSSRSPRRRPRSSRRHYYLEQGATMFHVINAFTKAAQDGRPDRFRCLPAGTGRRADIEPGEAIATLFNRLNTSFNR
jgi:hypothetical protein